MKKRKKERERKGGRMGKERREGSKKGNRKGKEERMTEGQKEEILKWRTLRDKAG